MNTKGDYYLKKLFAITLFLIIFMLASCTKKNMYDLAIDKVVEITCENSITKGNATGTLISKDGLILTNKHVIEKFTEDSVIKIDFMNDEMTYNAEIYNISDKYDLCLLKINKKTDYFKSLSTDIYVSNKVYTIGNANGYGLAYQEGIISSEYKNITYNEKNILAIQTNLEIYDGSSGGPLYNSKGALLGIMTFRIKDNGTYIPGMSFAIPTKIINEYLGELEK